MDSSSLPQLNRHVQAVCLEIIGALAILVLAAILWAVPQPAPTYADPATLYVDGATGSDTTGCTDPAGPCATISYALDQASEGDTILVAQGTYAENVVITQTVALKGGYEPLGWARCLRRCPTIIDGRGLAPAISVSTTLSSTTEIDGFTITQGNMGISILDSWVAIQNSKVIHNHSTYAGGGIHIDRSHVTISNSLIISNTADHGYGAICIISTILPEPHPPQSDVSIRNCTIANNRAPAFNGMICSLSYCSLVNSIVWGNAGEDLSGWWYSVTYSDIEQPYGGEGNISADPLFVDPARDDYHLQFGSPCVDTGTNTGAPDADLDGDPRPFDGDGDGSAGVDMGVDERIPSSAPGHLPVYRPDLDWDRDVDLADMAVVAGTWRATQRDPAYRQYYDLWHDSRIDVVDIMRVAAHWGEMLDLGPYFPFGYSPYRPGQAPGGPAPSPLEIGQDLEIMEPKTRLIRTYDACDELAAIPPIAREHGLQVVQGVYLSSSAPDNAQQMACFQDLNAANDNIVAGIIGNEVLLKGFLSEPQLIQYLDQARLIGNVPVTTGETWNTWCNEGSAKPRCDGRPQLGQAVDLVMAYTYPYWEQMPIDHAAAYVAATYVTLRATYPGQAVIVGETGWPTAGDPFGNAVPSLANQRRFIEELWQWANRYDIPILYFEPFDEDWKADEEGEVGRHWGMNYANRSPKHDGLDWSLPTPEPPPTTPIAFIDYPRGLTSTLTRSNCTIPIVGRAYNAGAGWHVRVEVYTNQWWVQDKWYADGLAPIVDGLWAMPEVYLAGQEVYNNHSIRATLVDDQGVPVSMDEVSGIVRINGCSPQAADHATPAAVPVNRRDKHTFGPEIDAAGPLAAPNSPDVTLRISPTLSVVYAGETFTAAVAIDGVADLAGFEFRLGYTPAMVHVDDVEIGSFPSGGGRTWNPLGPIVDNSAGAVIFGAYSYGQQPGPAGGGEIAVVTLTARQGGPTALSALTLRDVQVVDSHAVPQAPVAGVDGVVLVRNRPSTSPYPRNGPACPAPS